MPMLSTNYGLEMTSVKRRSLTSLFSAITMQFQAGMCAPPFTPAEFNAAPTPD
jgi:hypothetical protein